MLIEGDNAHLKCGISKTRGGGETHALRKQSVAGDRRAMKAP